MKICPICKIEYEDGLNYCLNDGTTLTDAKDYEPEETVTLSSEPTLEYRSPQTLGENKQTNPQNQVAFGSQPYSYKNARRQPNLFLIGGIVAGIVILILAGIVGGGFYLRSLLIPRENWTPKPSITPLRSITPYRQPTPDTKEKLKVEVIEKVKGSFNSQYLKCLVTNVSEKTIERPSVSITLYEKDVKVGNLSESVKLEFLKPNQTVPVWVRIGTDKKYDSAKASEGGLTRFTAKDENALFPKLALTETKMVMEKKTSMYNFQSYTEKFYIISGIVENQEYEKISPKIYAVYYDEKSEIVGFGSTNLSELKRGEKAKFELQEGETSLFGTPKTFELIVIDN